MLDIAVSIIIPVYNAQQSLDEAVCSVRGQTLEDLEIILIDDGSTDDSVQIMKLQAAEDDRIRILERKHGGVSAARNAGLEIAKGKYVAFADADDRLHPYMLETLYSSAEKYGCDIALCDITVKFRDSGDTRGTSLPLEQDTLLCDSQIQQKIGMLLLDNRIFTPVIDKLYLTEFLKRDEIRFKPDISIREDFFFNLQLFDRCRSCVYVPQRLYTYMVPSNRTGRRVHPDFFKISVELYGEKQFFAEKWGMMNKEMEVMLAYDFLLDVIESMRQACLQRNSRSRLKQRVSLNMLSEISGTPAAVHMISILSKSTIRSSISKKTDRQGSSWHSTWFVVMLYTLIKRKSCKTLYILFRILERFHVRMKLSTATINRVIAGGTVHENLQ